MTTFEDDDLNLDGNELDGEGSPDDDQENVEEFLIDIRTGAFIKPTPKNKLVQKVLRQLINSYGFAGTDLETNYDPRIKGKRNKKVDIAIFRPGTEHINNNVQRIIICNPKGQQDKLRSHDEAKVDLEKLQDLMQLFDNCRFGIWTNGFEEFFLQLEITRFEPRFKKLGVLPAPGEETEAADRTGGPTQVSADTEELEAALNRCYRYLNRNFGYSDTHTFQRIAMFFLAKIYDERCDYANRRFWIRGEEPFDETGQGQKEIERRVMGCLADAQEWQPNLLAKDWDLHLKPEHTAQIVKELAKYSFTQTHPLDRTKAYRTIVRMVMNGKEGRYPTPLNVAEMAVAMLDPKPSERILDCSCGTGTFLAMTAAYLYDKFLAEAGTNREEASPEQQVAAQSRTAEWVANNAFGCDIDEFLTVAARLNLLLTAGDPGQVFHLDARKFPKGNFDDVVEAAKVMALETLDVVVLNPWFSTKKTDLVTDRNILEKYDLGHVWEKDNDGGYRKTGELKNRGIPPEVLFLERALDWVKPGTGRVGILLPNGLLGNPGDEPIRWWILRQCEVLASVELPLEPFKVTVAGVGQSRLTPALPSFLMLRRRDREELMHIDHPEYSVFMAVAQKGGVDSRGKEIYEREPNGEEKVEEKEVIERVRIGDKVTIHKVPRKFKPLNDEIPKVAKRYQHFIRTGGLDV